jgi:Transcription initiation factor IID, 18kD subunit
MYAFGDDPNPAPESVAVLEDIVTEYINEMVLFPYPRFFFKGIPSFYPPVFGLGLQTFPFQTLNRNS